MKHLIRLPLNGLVSVTTLVLMTSAQAGGPTYVTQLSNGAPTNRVDIVTVGDGYTAPELVNDYPQDVATLLDFFFAGSQDPFPRYQSFFNLHRVSIASNESGADDPLNQIEVDTALNATYNTAGIDRLLTINSGLANSAVNTAMSGSGIVPDMRVALVNSEKYGGAGGTWATYAAGNSAALEVAIHEVGHSFGLLADEYGGNTEPYNGGEPSEPNVTADPNSGKWDRWVGYLDPDHAEIGPIGYYDGGRYYDSGIYRPSDNSKMRSLNRPFDAVSREQFIKRIYTYVDPLDGWEDNTQVQLNPDELFVIPVDPTVIEVEWSINGGSTIADGDFVTLEDLGLNDPEDFGIYTITARAFDTVLDFANTGQSLDWVRDPAIAAMLEQSIAWTIRVGLEADFNADGQVDLLDLDILGQSWQSDGDALTGDANGDGFVDLLDLDVLGVQWQQGNSSFNAALAASGILVPEPAALIVILGAVGRLAQREPMPRRSRR